MVTSGAVVQARLKAPSERRRSTANHRSAVLSLNGISHAGRYTKHWHAGDQPRSEAAGEPGTGSRQRRGVNLGALIGQFPAGAYGGAELPAEAWARRWPRGIE